MKRLLHRLGAASVFVLMLTFTASAGYVHITSYDYGGIDHTQDAKNWCRNQEICQLPCNNGPWGDPNYGHVKYCNVAWNCGLASLSNTDKWVESSLKYTVTCEGVGPGPSMAAASSGDWLDFKHPEIDEFLRKVFNGN